MSVVKFLGRDCELSTTGLRPSQPHKSAPVRIPPWETTQRVLEHIDAAFAPLHTRCFTVDAHAPHASASAWSSDCLRHWAPNGQCYYADMAHVEVCTAETSTPRTFAAQCWSTLHVAEAARRVAQAAAPSGVRYLLSAANVDALDPGVSWGSHLNVAVSGQLFDDLVVDVRRPPVLGFVASALAAAIPFFGCGYLLPLRDGSVRFSLSARAHHITRTLCDATTTPFARGLLNARREAHASGCERLHLIGFDFSLVSAALLGAFVQASLAAAEAGCSELVIEAPLDALHAWSLGVDADSGRSTGVATLQDGSERDLGTYVAEFAACLLRALRDARVAAAVGSGCTELLERTIDLARCLARGDLATCARHLDWAAKLTLLQAHCASAGARLDAPALRLFEHDFASTDPARGALWRLWEGGMVDPLVATSDIEACLRDGPAEGRGFTRGRLVQQFGHALADVAWDQVDLNLTPSRLGRRIRIAMPDPGGHGAAAFGPVLERAHSVAALAQLAGADCQVLEPLRDLRAELWLPPQRADHTAPHRSQETTS
jgi:hypothetical protein